MLSAPGETVKRRREVRYGSASPLRARSLSLTLFTLKAKTELITGSLHD